MSRAYRVRVSESVERIVHIEDGVSAELKLLPILPKERMGELLAEELVKRGFIAADGVVRREEAGGVVVEVTPETGVVAVRVSRAKEVKATLERETTVVEERARSQEAAVRRDLQAQLEKSVDRAKEDTRREATEALETRLRDLRGEMDTVVDQVTGTALKERAAQLGEVQEISEDAATGSLTIRVRV